MGQAVFYLCYNKMQDVMIANGDPRIKAHSEVVEDTVTPMLMDKTIGAPAGKKVKIGAVFFIKFEWNGWKRKDSPGDVLEPIFTHHAARAIRQVLAAQSPGR